MKKYRKYSLALLFVAGIWLSSCTFAISTNINLPTPTAEMTQDISNQVVNPPVSNGCKKIAFAMTQNSVSDIYAICPDGSDLTNLTNNPSSDSQPAWSPDGTKIAFVSSRDGNNQIYVMEKDGNNPFPLTADYENSSPVWLPDGKQIAFLTTDGEGLWWWRILNVENYALSQFSEPSYDFFFQTPAWSPDGQHIAHMSLVEQQPRNDGSSQIHVKTVDGSIDVALTNDTWANIHPVWSPDGERIAFLSERDGKYSMFALYIINNDGSKLQKLTEPIYPENITFSWSPDGQQIAISSDAVVGNIHLVDVNTGNPKELLNLPAGEWASFPSWQP
jgi:Tol biopolymer transport system component